MRTAAKLLPVAVLLLVAAACSSTTATTAGTTATSGATRGTVAAEPCPVAAAPVVVSVDQWGEIARQLAGRCGDVRTIIEGSSADPHDYEPTPSDNAAFTKAQLVLLNGLGYDAWASKAVDTVSPPPVVVNAGDVVGLSDGANPHLWYGPQYVQQVADAYTARLKQLLPGAESYLDARADVWKRAMQPYVDEVQKLRNERAGRTYGATESVFDDMASAVGLRDLTPDGYRSAAANESEPSPGELHLFQQRIEDHAIDVLVVNTQTEGATPELLRRAAEDAGVPIVEVTETVPPDATSFVGWQLGQLQQLDRALSGAK